MRFGFREIAYERSLDELESIENRDSRYSVHVTWSTKSITYGPRRIRLPGKYENKYKLSRREFDTAGGTSDRIQKNAINEHPLWTVSDALPTIWSDSGI